MIQDKHSLRSSTREEYVEYVFLSKLCAFGWSIDRFIEVARTQTDANGYDLVLSEGSVTRHVQLKASKIDGRAPKQKINIALQDKPSGCIVWMMVHPDTLEPEKYLWFGGKPGQKIPDLGDKVAKHTKANAQGTKSERQSMRDLAKSSFTPLETTERVFHMLFG